VIKIHHKYYLIVGFLFLFVKGFSQYSVFNEASIGNQKPEDSLNSFSFGVKGTFHQGAIFPHRKEVNEIVEGHTNGVEISFVKATTGKKRWQQLYHLPQVGISALAINLGNPNELGFGYGLFPFLELPITQGKINWNIKMGYGLGVIEQPFHKKENYKNVAIGSHVNAIIYFNSMLDLKLFKELTFSAGASLIHYSNGSSAQPNLGINIISLTSGMNYTFGKKEVEVREVGSARVLTWNNLVTSGLAMKEVAPIDGPPYWVSTLSFNRMKSRTEKSSFGFSADLFYNSSLSALIDRDSSVSSTDLDNFRVGIIGLYSFDVGEFSVLLGAGAYLYSNYKGNGVIYNKLETRYWVSDQLFFRFGVKTHLAAADFVEYGVGYKF
jgi:hypothetical protein